jgi:hypothetical protein
MIVAAKLAPVGDVHGETSYDESNSMTSSVSCPTRGCVSAPGSTIDGNEMLIDGRCRGCHLIFNTVHFLTSCPLLRADVKQAAHLQTDLKYPGRAPQRNPHPSGRKFPPRTLSLDK